MANIYSTTWSVGLSHCSMRPLVNNRHEKFNVQRSNHIRFVYANIKVLHRMGRCCSFEASWPFRQLVGRDSYLPNRQSVEFDCEVPNRRQACALKDRHDISQIQKTPQVIFKLLYIAACM